MGVVWCVLHCPIKQVCACRHTRDISFGPQELRDGSAIASPCSRSAFGRRMSVAPLSLCGRQTHHRRPTWPNPMGPGLSPRSSLRSGPSRSTALVQVHGPVECVLHVAVIPSMPWASGPCKWEMRQQHLAKMRVTRRLACRRPVRTLTWPTLPSESSDLCVILRSSTPVCMERRGRCVVVELGGRTADSGRPAHGSPGCFGDPA